MAEFDLILRGARVLTSTTDSTADIAVKDGRIAAVGDVAGKATTEMECTDKVVSPGGVDVHCHIEQMSGMGLMNADTFETATHSALVGGTTTVVSFAAQAKGQSLAQAMTDYAVRATVGAMTDYAFHIIVSDFEPPLTEQELRSLIRDGHRSIKVFTTYNIKLDDQSICDVLSIAKEEGALVCIHAENDGLISWTKNRLLAAGKNHPRHHALSHPRLAEIEAVNRLISFAEFFATPVMLFHISTAEAVSAIRSAKARGVPVWAETCPHYLFMDESELDRPGHEGAKWMCSPPQRTVPDQDALWDGLGDGTLSVISSDHAPYRYDNSGKMSAGPDATFAEIANGLPGLETRMPLMFDAIVSNDRLAATDFARLTASEPARIHGLADKGNIAEGFQADLIVWDPFRKVTFDANDLNDNVGYNPWVDRTVTGWPEMVFLRGELVVEDGKCRAKPGHGKWIDRPRPGLSSDIEAAKEYREAIG
ncbi:MAG: dihydropyrimidinase [Silicimonas sp.]|nr:dihydropyrimidinase [Silicimonas sp.]